jgi:lysophospholipase L1-like esterase
MNRTHIKLGWLWLVTAAMVAPLHVQAEHDGKLQILLVGDSTTEGIIPRKTNPEGPHLEEVVRILLAAEKDLPPCEVINLGVSGEYVRRLLDGGRYDRDVANKPGVDYVFIRYGLNDHNKREGFEANYVKDYQELIARLRKDHPQATLVVTTVIPYMDEATSEKINALNREVAMKEKLPLFDLYPRYAEELKKQGANALNYRRFPVEKIPTDRQELVKSFLVKHGATERVVVMDNRLDAHFAHLPDWFGDRHPNLAGYHVIGDETAKWLAKTLREKTKK